MSSTAFDHVSALLLDLGYPVSRSIPEENILVINDPEEGISNLMLEINEPILVMEQFLFDLSTDVTVDQLKDLLVWNAGIVHGALALVGNKLIFRDTLQLDNLDANELEGSINSLKLFVAENLDKLLSYAHPAAV